MEQLNLTQEEINKIIQETSPFGTDFIRRVPLSISRKDILEKYKADALKMLQRDKDLK